MISDFREFAVDGTLMTYGPNLNEMNRHDAYYVGQILEDRAEYPVEQPMTFDFVVNMKTARDWASRSPTRSCSRSPRSSTNER